MEPEELQRFGRFPDQLRRETSAAYELADAWYLVAARKWLHSRQRWLLLLGPSDTGKTYAGAWAVQQLGGAFIQAAELVHLKPGWSRFDRACRWPAVLVDDLGVEQLGISEREAFDAFVNRRHLAGLRGVLTANLAAYQVERRYGNRVWRRLRESGTCIAEAPGGQHTMTQRGLRPRTRRPNADVTKVGRGRPLTADVIAEVLADVGAQWLGQRTHEGHESVVQAVTNGKRVAEHPRRTTAEQRARLAQEQDERARAELRRKVAWQLKQAQGRKAQQR